MGGNAIKQSKRISREKYLNYLTELKDIFKDLKINEVKAYRNKHDFGDIDLVVLKQLNTNIKSLVKERLNPSEYHDNGPFFSFLYKDAQVDFILMNEREFESATNYFHWNDLGNFIGRVARSVNFKYGHDGLSYEEHLDDHYKISVHVSNDMRLILQFLGYDYQRWEDGFNNFEDILEYAASSTRFNSLYFTLEDQNHNDRVRNKKRKMYQLMLNFINEKNILPKPKLTKEERLSVYSEAIDLFGNDFNLEVEEAKVKYEKYKEFKKLFNGDIVSELTGRTGKDLGNLMIYLKRLEPNLQEKVLQLGTSFVESFIRNGEKNYVNTF